MKKIIRKAALLTLLSMVNAQFSTALAQGTAFTYQGRLNDGSGPANGNYDLRFILYDNSVGGNQQGPILTNSATAVSNGLFTVTLDFGSVFPGAVRWLDIGVRTNGSGVFTTLSTRQLLASAPYAITAGNVISGGLAAGTYGSAVTFSNAANSFAGNGAALLNVNAVTLDGLSAGNFWQLGGNAGTSPGANFLGTADNQPLVIRANNLPVMQLAFASNSVSGYSPNVIGGNGANSVSAGVVGATISGGGVAPGFLTGPNTVTADFGTVVGGSTCSAQGVDAIAGGSISTASGPASIALGAFSKASGDYSVALGELSMATGTNSTAFGYYSKATNSYATAMGYQSVAGGEASTAMGESTATGVGSTAMGGSIATGLASTAMGNSTANGDYSTALGGSIYGGVNEADGASSFAAGSASLAANDYSFVWSDGSLPVYTSFSTTAPDQFLIHAAGGVGIGLNNPTAALHVASASNYTFPQAQITQQNSSDSCRLRLNVSGHPSWEMDVSSDPTAPQLQFWNGTLQMYITYTGDAYAHSFNNTSDRNAKENFSDVSPKEVLDKVAALPITRWNFKEDKAVEHLGPMAQDFRAAFGLGTDDKHIATVDEEGVALAAIQGLNQKLEQKDAEIMDLKTRLEKLERLVESTVPSAH